MIALVTQFPFTDIPLGARGSTLATQLRLYFYMYRSTPVETLHTILLGACKYMLRSFMDKRNATEKKEILARISSFPYSGFSCRLTANICYHFRSFIGRDFKTFIQMALFIIPSYLSESELKCWYI